MFSGRRLCLVFVGIIQTVIGWSAATSAGSENALEYGIFCNIFRLLQYSPPGPYFNSNEKDPGRIVDSISYLLNSSRVENFQNDSIDEDLKTWTGSLKISRKQMKSSMGAKFDFLLLRAGRLSQELREQKSQAGLKLNEARDELAKALYGEQARRNQSGPEKPAGLSLDSPGVFQDSSKTGDACGTKGSSGSGSAETGKSLVNDFFCLCVGSANSEKPCANELQADGSINSNKFQLNGQGSVDASWEKIIGLCPAGSEAPGEQTLSTALRVFRSALGRGLTGGSDAKQVGHYVFGEIDALATGCTGADGQICVNYAENLKPGGKGIPWENHIRTAIRALGQSRGQAQAANETYKELQRLQEQAKLIYLDAFSEDGEKTINGIGDVKAESAGSRSIKAFSPDSGQSNYTKQGAAVLTTLSSGLSLIAL